MFHRMLNAMSEYLITISATPDSHLYSYTCCDWSGWFYCNIIACRLVFLADNDRQGHTALEGVPNVMASVRQAPRETSSSTNGRDTQVDDSWAPASVARETRVQEQFENFINRLSFTMPSAFALHRDAHFATDPGNRDPLSIVVYLQHSILKTFLRRLQGHDTSNQDCTPIPGSSDNPDNPPRYTDPAPLSATSSHTAISGAPRTETPGVVQGQEQCRSSAIPLFKTINTIDFDSIQLPSTTPMQQEMYDDWMWDTMMADFTMPPI
jgi:hypothetical protein